MSGSSSDYNIRKSAAPHAFYAKAGNAQYVLGQANECTQEIITILSCDLTYARAVTAQSERCSRLLSRK